MDNVDFNDKAVLDSIGTGRTDGVFQVESGGMKNFMKELKPQNPVSYTHLDVYKRQVMLR